MDSSWRRFAILNLFYCTDIRSSSADDLKNISTFYLEDLLILFHCSNAYFSTEIENDLMRHIITSFFSLVVVLYKVWLVLNFEGFYSSHSAFNEHFVFQYLWRSTMVRNRGNNSSFYRQKGFAMSVWMRLGLGAKIFVAFWKFVLFSIIYITNAEIWIFNFVWIL